MNKEIQAIINSLENTLNGAPWFGKPVYTMLESVNDSKVYEKPNNKGHSLIDLLYHMITWSDFTLKRLEKKPINDMAAFDKTDWREIDPAIHTWEKGLAEFKEINKKIIEILNKKEDSLLIETVDYRKYIFRDLLYGLIQHHIYHIGQVAYVNKLLI